MLLAKCCHDVDLIRHMVGRRCVSVQSFGSLLNFHPGRRPEGAADRCMDCPDAVESACPFSAKEIYLERAKSGYFGWPVQPILEGEHTVAAVEEALRSGPYGRCVWACSNDVCDHQTVNMQFEPYGSESGGSSGSSTPGASGGGVAAGSSSPRSGPTATLTAVAFTKAICQRSTRIFGTKGEIQGDGASKVKQFSFLTGETKVHTAPPVSSTTALQGHDGADYALIDSFCRAVYKNDASLVATGPAETLESHLITFAAEASRRMNAVVQMKDVMAYGPKKAAMMAAGVVPRPAAGGKAAVPGLGKGARSSSMGCAPRGSGVGEGMSTPPWAKGSPAGTRPAAAGSKLRFTSPQPTSPLVPGWGAGSSHDGAAAGGGGEGKGT